MITNMRKRNNMDTNTGKTYGIHYKYALWNIKIGRGFYINFLKKVNDT